MPVSDKFRSAQAANQQEIDENRDQIRDDFSPPTSPAGILYPCILKSIRGDVDKDDIAYVWLDLVIQSGEYEGRSFSIYFTMKRLWQLGPLFALAQMLTKDSKYTENKLFGESVDAIDAFCASYCGIQQAGREPTRPPTRQ